MKSVKNKKDYTLSVRMYGRLFELPPNHHWTAMNFWGGEEDLHYLAIKMKDCFEFEGEWPDEIECPCCGAMVRIKESVASEEEEEMLSEEEPKEEKPRKRSKK